MRSRQQEIINEFNVLPAIDPEREIQHRVAFLTAKLGETGRKGFVLGISGGQDSLLAGLLAQQAVEQHRAAGYDAEFHAMLLPYGTQADRADAELAFSVINPGHLHDIDIKPATDAVVHSFERAGMGVGDFHKGNIKARQRMIMQYLLAGEKDLLVLGTDHAAEGVTGFFTKYGDGAADILPLAGLNKRQGRELLTFLRVPEIFTTKPPTADLLDDRPGQPDEHELAITYEQIDTYLEGGVVDEPIAKAIEQRHDATRHKRRLPVGYERTATR